MILLYLNPRGGLYSAPHAEFVDQIKQNVFSIVISV